MSGDGSTSALPHSANKRNRTGAMLNSPPGSWQEGDIAQGQAAKTNKACREVSTLTPITFRRLMACSELQEAEGSLPRTLMVADVPR